ncbi:MAG: DUF1638 domain-containing protein [Methanosarcinaceae archaeon]|nr:DUF1638 domain-containing protein [Methanosarcinaceae archaeon]
MILGIVSCRIFENELVQLLKEHIHFSNIFSEVEIFVHKDDTSFKFIEKLSSQNISHFCYSDFGEIEKKSVFKSDLDKLLIFIHLIPFSMEARPDIIKETVYPVISKYTEISDAVFVMYGMCGNVLGYVEIDLGTDSCPVFILKNKDGSVVDDCICASVGGKDNFIEIVSSQERGVGIYFLTPMQAVYWKEISVASMLTPDPDDEEMLRMIFEYSGYKYAGKIKSDLDFDNQYDEKTEEFSKKSNLEILHVPGSFKIFLENFKRVENFLLTKHEKLKTE